MRSRRFASLLVATMSAAILCLAGCSSDSGPNDPGNNGGGDGITLAVDSKIVPPVATLPVEPGSDPRPIAAVASPHGHQAEFVANELWIKPGNQTELEGFLARWNGEVIGTYDPADFGLGGDPAHYLVRVVTDAADATGLGEDLERISGITTGDFKVSSQTALNLIAANVQEAALGLEVGMNWVGRGAGFIDSETEEAPTGNLPGYTPDAFTWTTHSAGSNQDIGVAEAWRMLELAGRLENRVKIAILDMGFSNTNDLKTGKTVISNVPFIENPLEQENLLGCGSPCPWHGNRVASVAMALADDSYGAAGPAGPVAEPILVFTLYDYFTSIGALGAARAAGADIANMSYGAPVPGILSWTALPFEAATAALRASGMLIFAAAGNDGADVDDESCFGFCWENTLFTPCENQGVICVGGLASDSRNRASNSNYGRGSVDIYAPYVNSVGPDPARPANAANSGSGTSYSSPFAAGVAALIWAADPGLSADEVEDILIRSAHSSEDGLVNLYVNAAEAVRLALGDAAPYVNILSPANGASFPRGSTSVSFSADVEDLEDPNPSIIWTSSRDGEIGNSDFFAYTRLSVGSHVITATARDNFGNESSDQVTITIINTAPTMAIDNPSDGARFFESQTISFQGTSFDPNELEALPNGAVSWWIDGVNRGTGHSISVAAATLGIGNHTVVFRGDDGSLTGQDDITIAVDTDPVDVPPSVAILEPASGASLWVDTYDPLEEAWFIDVNFLGTAVDTEDGSLNGTDVVWKAIAAGEKSETLGTGRSLNARLYSRQPFATSYTITLSATDSAGQTSSTSIGVTVNILSEPSK